MEAPKSTKNSQEFTSWYQQGPGELEEWVVGAGVAEPREGIWPGRVGWVLAETVLTCTDLSRRLERRFMGDEALLWNNLSAFRAKDLNLRPSPGEGENKHQKVDSGETNLHHKIRFVVIWEET